MNTDFQKWERELIKEFEAKFPQDLLSIISEDADLPIEKIDFAFSGVGQKEEHNEWSFYIPTDIYPYPVGSRYNNFINLFNTISEAPLIRDVDYVQFHYSFDNALMTEMRTPLGIAAFNEYSFIHLQNKLAINWMNVLPIPEPATEIFERCNNSDLPLAA
ncbi:MAG: hypothetical protein IPJ66_01330 [Bacteroidetes bacterium]|nr:hypothetical protein [Bacteroidota bacterium]